MFLLCMLPRFCFRRQTRHADYYHIGILTIGTGVLGTILGIEIVMIRKNFSFH